MERTGMTGDQFATLGSTYEQFSGAPFRRFLEVPSVLGVVGDVQDQAVLDFGCGAGDYTRWLRQRGAARVVGYDISAGMVEHARRREQESPLGIEYLTELPAELNGTFDLVLSVYVLPYAESASRLREQCEIAARMLRTGGRLVTLPVHPEVCWDQPAYYARYGFRLHITDNAAPGDGDPLQLRLDIAGAEDQIVARYWSRAALVAALGEAGFTALRWESHRVTDEGVASYGADFWEPYLSRPHAAIITGRKSPVPK